MKHIALVLFAATLAPLHANAQPAQTDRLKAWFGDLDVLVDCLKNKQIKPFDHIQPEQFDKAVTDLRQKIPTLKDHEILVEFVKLAASIQVAHTAVYPTGQKFKMRLYPVHFVMARDGVFIGGADEGHRDLLRARLTGIGKLGLDDVLTRVAALNGKEYGPTHKYYANQWLNNAEALAALGIVEDMENATFKIVDASGKAREVVLSPGAKGKPVGAFDPNARGVVVSRRVPRPWYGFEWLADSKTVYCWYDKCDNIAGRPVETWCKDVLAEIAAKPVERVVLDMRWNGGGSSELAKPLLNGLRGDQNINRKGKLFVLVGPDTFSSALWNVGFFRQHTNAVLVGLHSRGLPNSPGEVKTVTLPHCGWLVQYPTRFWWRAGMGVTRLAPDVEVEWSSADVFEGRDPLLDAALKFKP